MLAIPAYDDLNARHQVLQELGVELLHQGRLFLLRLVHIEDVDQRLGTGGSFYSPRQKSQRSSASRLSVRSSSGVYRSILENLMTFSFWKTHSRKGKGMWIGTFSEAIKMSPSLNSGSLYPDGGQHHHQQRRHEHVGRRHHRPVHHPHQREPNTASQPSVGHDELLLQVDLLQTEPGNLFNVGLDTSSAHLLARKVKIQTPMKRTRRQRMIVHKMNPTYQPFEPIS